MFGISDNIIKLRRKKGITQEQLADFLGVTKASVSKWENRQSMPDISLLPMISSFFDISIDELLGYRPKLSKEEIDDIYEKLCSRFASEPFEEVMKESEALVKQYYTCYPFLFKLAVLWLNHHMLSDNPERRLEILNSASDLCKLILEHEKEQALRNDAIAVNAQILLIAGRYQETVELIESIADPFSSISQAQSILVQAYQAMGNTEKAEEYIQVIIFNEVMGLVSNSTVYLANNVDNPEKCMETIKRTEGVIKSYNLLNVHPNTTALFYLQAAMVYANHGLKDECLDSIEKYGNCILTLFGNGIVMIQSDSYFDRLESAAKSRQACGPVPRDKKVVFASAMSIFEYPLFAEYKEEKRFMAIKQKLERKGEEICRI